MAINGLASKNKIVIGSGFKFGKAGTDLVRTIDKSAIIINGTKVYVDDLDVYTGKNPHIKIYGDIEFDTK